MAWRGLQIRTDGCSHNLISLQQTIVKSPYQATSAGRLHEGTNGLASALSFGAGDATVTGAAAGTNAGDAGVSGVLTGAVTTGAGAGLNAGEATIGTGAVGTGADVANDGVHTAAEVLSTKLLAVGLSFVVAAGAVLPITGPLAVDSPLGIGDARFSNRDSVMLLVVLYKPNGRNSCCWAMNATDRSEWTDG